MGKKKRHIPVELAVIVILVALVVGGVFLAYRHDERKRESVSGTYSSEYYVNGSEDKSVVIKYIFDAKDGTFEEMWGEQSLMTGSYTVKDDRITVVTDGNADIGAESETMHFLVDGQVLIPEGYIYKGSIPEGKTFDAEVTMTDIAGTVYTIKFSSDGSYTYTIKNSTETSTTNFTYEREGNYIHCVNEAGVQMTDFYIYKGQVAGLSYHKEQ